MQEIDRGITKLRRRIEQVVALDPRTTRYDDARVDTVEADIRETIRDAFGPQSPEFNDHQNHRIWRGGFNLMDEQADRQRKFLEGIPQTLSMLQGLIDRLEERREDVESDAAPAAPARPVRAKATGRRRVFLVHGRDESTKESVARFLEKLGFSPVVLHEQPNKGRTIIEKFEDHADVDFAVILLTPDDMGHLATNPEQAKPRARQNVIFELGYFVGRMGRERVCALHRGGVELPSELDGIIHVSMDAPHGWHFPLARELKAAGLDVDLNRAL